MKLAFCIAILLGLSGLSSSAYAQHFNFGPAAPFRGYTPPTPFLSASERGQSPGGPFAQPYGYGTSFFGFNGIAPITGGAYPINYLGGYGGYGGFGGFGGYGYGGYGYGGGYRDNNNMINNYYIINSNNTSSGRTTWNTLPSADNSTPAEYAQVTLHIPDGAEVKIGGKKMEQTGTTQIYKSPNLPKGGSYLFDLEISWMENNKRMEEKRKMNVAQGESRSYTIFAQPQQAYQLPAPQSGK